MGTLNFTVGRYAKSKGSGAATLMSSNIRASDAFTTSTSAANVEADAADIIMAIGEVLRVHADEAMWISFGGVAATVGTGFYVPAETTLEWECATAGLVSAIDVV
jgi:hypothetical protein